MKAMVLRAFGKPLSWEDVPEPTIGPRQALVRSQANGLCATDLKIVDGLVKSVKKPLRLGHESAGVVVEVGSEVETVQPGDRVVMVCKQTLGWPIVGPPPRAVLLRSIRWRYFGSASGRH